MNKTFKAVAIGCAYIADIVFAVVVLALSHGDGLRCIAPLLVAGIGAGISAIASGISSAIGNAQKRRAHKRLMREYDDAVSGVTGEINTRSADRADTQDALRRMGTYNDEMMRRYQTDAIRSGATDEAKVAMANNLQKNTAAAVSAIAANDERRKDSLRDKRRGLLFEKAKQKASFEGDTSYLDNMASAIGNSATQIATAYMTGRGNADGIPATTDGNDEKQQKSGKK